MCEEHRGVEARASGRDGIIQMADRVILYSFRDRCLGVFTWVTQDSKVGWPPLATPWPLEKSLGLCHQWGFLGSICHNEQRIFLLLLLRLLRLPARGGQGPVVAARSCALPCSAPVVMPGDLALDSPLKMHRTDRKFGLARMSTSSGPSPGEPGYPGSEDIVARNPLNIVGPPAQFGVMS